MRDKEAPTEEPKRKEQTFDVAPREISSHFQSQHEEVCGKVIVPKR